MILAVHSVWLCKQDHHKHPLTKHIRKWFYFFVPVMLHLPSTWAQQWGNERARVDCRVGFLEFFQTEMESLSVEELSCPVCCEIFRSPVFLSCSHSVCKDCLKQFWRSKKTQECPVCRRRSSKPDPPGNLVLKNLCESFLNVEEVCDLHGEKLKLFCVEDKESVCLVCRDSEKHNQHKFRTISELLPSYKVRKDSNAVQYLAIQKKKL